MRITKLYIKSYKNLQDFTWELNPEYPVAVIVGKNASGKSNLLEAILLIFAQVRTDNVDKKFYFEVVYQDIDRNEIAFLNDENGFSSTRNGNAIDPNRVFPKQIVSYYAGISERIVKLIGNYRKKKESTQELDIVYLREIHFQFALVALLSSKLNRIKNNLLADKFNILELSSFAIRIEKPRRFLFSDKETFWSAPANLKVFFETLLEFGKLESLSNGYIIGFDKNDLENIVDSSVINNNEVTLFEYLSEAYLGDYIRRIEIEFKKKGVLETLTFDDLSEGEKQRIGMRGTIELFLGNETLFLLDEPDAFAHPRWQWDFVPDLQETLGDSLSSQVIFVTHSPLVLSTVKDNAFVMDGGKITEIYGTYGQDANMSLLKMKTDNRLDEIQQQIDAYFALLESGKVKESETLELKKALVNQLGLNHPALLKAKALETLYE